MHGIDIGFLRLSLNFIPENKQGLGEGLPFFWLIMNFPTVGWQMITQFLFKKMLPKVRM